MAIDVKIADEKLQYDVNRKTVKVPALSSWRTDKYEYLAGEEVLQFNQS